MELFELDVFLKELFHLIVETGVHRDAKLVEFLWINIDEDFERGFFTPCATSAFLAFSNFTLYTK